MAGMLASLELPQLREVVSFTEWEAFLAGAGDATLPVVDPRDPALVLYTSGTTGTPKGAVLHHRGVVNNARLSYARMGARDGFVQVNPMPLYHAAGCAMSVLGSLAFDGTLVLPPAFDPALVLALIESERADFAGGVPTMLIALLEHPRSPPPTSARSSVLLTGGAVVPPALVTRVEAAFGAPLSIVFAQTEASPAITQTGPDDSAQDRARRSGGRSRTPR